MYSQNGMKNIERPAFKEPKPGDGSGIRRIKKKTDPEYDEKAHERVMQQMRKEEEMTDPHVETEHLPKDEPDTAEVWGVTEEEMEQIDREDRRDERIHKRLREVAEEEYEKDDAEIGLKKVKKEEEIGRQDTEMAPTMIQKPKPRN